MRKNSTGHYLWLVGVIGVFALMIALRCEPQKGLTALIQFGADFQPVQTPALAAVPHHVRAPTGFDGQFYAQIALDPLLLNPHTAKALDDPAYRARRILMPGFAFLAGFGEPKFIIQLYPLLNIACWLGLLFWLLKLLAPIDNFRRAIITSMLFSTGVLETVRLSLTDLLAAMLLLAPCVAAMPEIGVVLCLTLACLCRETSALGVLAFFARPNTSTLTLRKRVLWIFATLLPLALWLGYLHLRLGNTQFAGGNLSLPLFGAWSALKTNCLRFSSDLSPAAIGAIAAVIGLHWQAAHLWLHRQWDDPLWRLGALFSVLLVLLGPKVWEVPLAACRDVLPMTLAFNLLLCRHPQPRWFLLAATNAYSLYGVWKFFTYLS